MLLNNSNKKEKLFELDVELRRKAAVKMTTGVNEATTTTANNFLQTLDRSTNAFSRGITGKELKLDVAVCFVLFVFKLIFTFVEIIVFCFVYQKLNASLASQNLDNFELSNSDEANINSVGLLNHPKYAQYFKKRVCVRFVPDAK